MNINRQLLSIGATVLVLFLILRKSDFSDLYNVLIDLDYIFFSLSVLFYIIFSIVIGYRFFFLLDKEITLGRVLKCHLGSMLLSDITPGRLGYFSLVHHLKDKIALEESTNYILMGQLNDFINKLLSIMIFSFLLGSSVLDENTLVVVILFTFVCLFLLFVITYGLGFQYIMEKFSPSNKFFKFMIEVRNYAIYDSKKIIKFVIITTFAWLSLGLFWYFSALSLGIDNFSVFYHMILHGVSSVLSFIPFVLGGMGLQEATLVTLLTLNNLDYELALAFAILTRGINLLLDLILGVKYVWGAN